MRNLFSELITLAAGQVSKPIAVPGNMIAITPNAVDEYSTDIAVKLDNGGFRKIPTGSGWRPQDSAGLPIVFNMVQFKNTGAQEITFHALAGMGEYFNFNLALNGEITVAQVTIDDAVPIKVEQQTSVDVLHSAATMALLNRIADALDSIDEKTV